MSLFVQDRAKWERVIDSWPEWEVTAKEKLLARHLPDILDWCGEIADKDEDFWGDRVRIYPSMCCKQTGLSKMTIWRIMDRWNDCKLVSRRSENFMDNQGVYHGRTYLELDQRFYDGDIRTGREEKRQRGQGVKKGHKFITCPNCGYRIKKGEVHWEEYGKDDRKPDQTDSEFLDSLGF